VKRGDFEKYIANLDQLRNRTLEAAGNGVLADMLDSINDKSARSSAASSSCPARRRGPGAAPRGARRDAQGRRRQSEELRAPTSAASREYLSAIRASCLGITMPAKPLPAAQRPPSPATACSNWDRPSPVRFCAGCSPTSVPNSIKVEAADGDPVRSIKRYRDKSLWPRAYSATNR